MSRTRVSYSIVMAAFLLTQVNSGGTAAWHENLDDGHPEHVLFLLDALDAMTDYHQAHRMYPKHWHDLDFEFSATPYRVGDPGVRPSKEQGNRWRPRDCHYTYLIKEAGKDHFLVQALDRNDHPEWEIRDGLTKPRKVEAKPGNGR